MVKGERGYLRNIANQERAEDNFWRRQRGDRTPWELAKAARKQRRATDRRVRARARQWALQGPDKASSAQG